MIRLRLGKAGSDKTEPGLFEVRALAVQMFYKKQGALR